MQEEIKTSGKVKVPFFTSFIRSQASSAVSTVFDFGASGLLYYVFSVYYGVSTAAGNIFGAIVSFYLGRNWAFKRKDGKISHQAIKYAITSLTSSAINTTGVIYLTENFGLEFLISKAIVAFIVGATFNFLMFRYFVYR